MASNGDGADPEYLIPVRPSRGHGRTMASRHRRCRGEGTSPRWPDARMAGGSRRRLVSAGRRSPTSARRPARRKHARVASLGSPRCGHPRRHAPPLRHAERGAGLGEQRRPVRHARLVRRPGRPRPRRPGCRLVRPGDREAVVGRPGHVPLGSDRRRPRLPRAGRPGRGGAARQRSLLGGARPLPRGRRVAPRRRLGWSPRRLRPGEPRDRPPVSLPHRHPPAVPRGLCGAEQGSGARRLRAARGPADAPGVRPARLAQLQPVGDRDREHPEHGRGGRGLLALEVQRTPRRAQGEPDPAHAADARHHRQARPSRRPGSRQHHLVHLAGCRRVARRREADGAHQVGRRGIHGAAPGGVHDRPRRPGPPDRGARARHLVAARRRQHADRAPAGPIRPASTSTTPRSAAGRS